MSVASKHPRTEEEIVAMFGDYGTQDVDVARRTLNFIPLGRELKLARLDALADELGYFGRGAKLRLLMLRDNQVAIEGKARNDLLLAIGENASARIPMTVARTKEQPEEKK